METNYRSDKEVFYSKLLKYSWTIIFILYTFFFISIPYSFITKFIIIVLWFALLILSIRKIIGDKNNIKHYV